MQFHVSTATGKTEIRGGGHSQVIEVMIGESVLAHSAASVEIVDQPGGAASTIEGSTVTPHEVGRHRLRATASDGSQTDLRFCVCEPECFARIESAAGAYPRHGAGPLDHRAILRSLSTHAPWFTGRASQLIGRSLGSFGA